MGCSPHIKRSRKLGIQINVPFALLFFDICQKSPDLLLICRNGVKQINKNRTSASLTTPNAPYRQSGTLRVAVFLCGAVLGVLGRDVVVKLSAAWGGLGKHKPLVEATLDWLKCPSPKLVPPEDRLARGGGMI
jgi:hypothetical protein